MSLILYLRRALKNWNKDDINKGIINGSEIDVKIKEDFNETDLVTFLTKYAEGNHELGGNILTGNKRNFVFFFVISYFVLTCVISPRILFNPSEEFDILGLRSQSVVTRSATVIEKDTTENSRGH